MRSDFELMFEQLIERGFKFSLTHPPGTDPLMQYAHPKDATEEDAEWLIKNRDRVRAYLVLQSMPDVNEHLVAAYGQAVQDGFYNEFPKKTRAKKVAA